MTLPEPSQRAALVHACTRYAPAIFAGGTGIVLTVSAGLAGDWRAAVLGLGAITGVILTVVGLRRLRRLNQRIDHLEHGMARLTDPRRPAQRACDDDNPNPTAADQPDSPTAPLIDLASLGPGDPSSLVAATLDRSAFPRLATSIAHSPATGGRTPSAEGSERTGRSLSEPAPDAAQETDAHGLTTLNLIRQWKHGLRTGDLAICRRTYAALVDTTDAHTATGLKRQLDDLADRVEKALRAEFVAFARRRDYEALLALGQRIEDLLPNRPIAAEFLRLRPYLQTRCPGQSHSTRDGLRVAGK